MKISRSQTQSYWLYCLSWCWLHHCHHKLPLLCEKGSRPLTSLWSGWIRCHCTPPPTFFQHNSSNKIEFWDFLSKARWHLHAKVDDHTKSTIVPSTPSQFVSLDAIREKNQARHALINGSPPSFMATTKATNSYSLEFTKKVYSLKEGDGSNILGPWVSLCARATIAILSHPPIVEFRKWFFPQNNHACPCGHNRVETRAHILNDCSRFIYKNDDRMVIKHFACSLQTALERQVTSLNMCYRGVIECCSFIPAFSFLLLSLLLCLDQLWVIWVFYVSR